MKLLVNKGLIFMKYYVILLYKLLLIIEENRPELLCYKEKIKLKVLVIRKKNVVRNISIKLLIKILYDKFNKYIRINFLNII